jgi:hypothetical protein
MNLHTEQKYTVLLRVYSCLIEEQYLNQLGSAGLIQYSQVGRLQ